MRAAPPGDWDYSELRGAPCDQGTSSAKPVSPERGLSSPLIHRSPKSAVSETGNSNIITPPSNKDNINSNYHNDNSEGARKLGIST